MKVGYQGVDGAFSHKAVVDIFPKAKKYIGFQTFELAMQALASGKIDRAVIPIANSTAGRVMGVHNLIYENDLHIIGEYFLPVHHNLIVNNGVKIKDIKRVLSHPQALAQSSKFIKQNKFDQVAWSDTAESVKHIVETGSAHDAAIASDLAAEIYGAKILKKNIENEKGNTTRFVVLSRSSQNCKETKGVLTSIFYTTKNIPAALYKSLGGFATEGVNLVTIESFVPMKRNGKARFYVEFEGSPKDEKVARALDELEFYSEVVRILGVYKEAKHR